MLGHISPEMAKALAAYADNMTRTRCQGPCFCTGACENWDHNVIWSCADDEEEDG